MGYLFLRAELRREVLGFFFQILLNFEWIPVEVHEDTRAGVGTDVLRRWAYLSILTCHFLEHLKSFCSRDSNH